MSNIEGADLFYRTKNNSQLIYFPEKNTASLKKLSLLLNKTETYTM